MNLPGLASSQSLRRLVVFAGVFALAAPTFACGDDDDDNGVQAGTGGKSGSGGTGGSDACGKGGKTGSCSAGSGGSGGKAGSGGTGGSGNGGAGAAPEEDGGMTDDAGEDPGPHPYDFRRVTFVMTGLTDELGKFMQFRLISGAGDLIAIGVVHGAPAAEFYFELPNSSPAGEVVTFEVWADTHAGPGGANAYDAAMDNAWTGSIPAGAWNVDAIVPIAGGVQASPPALTQGAASGSLGFTMMNTVDYDNDPFELRVIDNATRRLVGRQLVPDVGNEVGLEVYGVLQTGVEYQVDYAIDANRDSSYDAPPTDASWRQFVTATATGYSGGPGATILLSAVPSSDDYVDVAFRP